MLLYYRKTLQVDLTPKKCHLSCTLDSSWSRHWPTFCHGTSFPIQAFYSKTWTRLQMKFIFCQKVGWNSGHIHILLDELGIYSCTMYLGCFLLASVLTPVETDAWWEGQVMTMLFLLSMMVKFYNQFWFASTCMVQLQLNNLTSKRMSALLFILSALLKYI